VVPGKCPVQINASEFFACHFSISKFLFRNNSFSELWAVSRVRRSSVKFGRLLVFCRPQNSLWTKKSYADREKHADINKKLINLVPSPSVFAFETPLRAPTFTLLIFLISSALTPLCPFFLFNPIQQSPPSEAKTSFVSHFMEITSSLSCSQGLVLVLAVHHVKPNHTTHSVFLEDPA